MPWWAAGHPTDLFWTLVLGFGLGASGRLPRCVGSTRRPRARRSRRAALRPVHGRAARCEAAVGPPDTPGGRALQGADAVSDVCGPHDMLARRRCLPNEPPKPRSGPCGDGVTGEQTVCQITGERAHDGPFACRRGSGPAVSVRLGYFRYQLFAVSGAMAYPTRLKARNPLIVRLTGLGSRCPRRGARARLRRQTPARGSGRASTSASATQLRRSRAPRPAQLGSGFGTADRRLPFLVTTPAGSGG